MLLVSPCLFTSRLGRKVVPLTRGNCQLQFSINLLLLFPVGSQSRGKYSSTVSPQYLERVFDCLGLKRRHHRRCHQCVQDLSFDRSPCLPSRCFSSAEALEHKRKLPAQRNPTFS